MSTNEPIEEAGLGPATYFRPPGPLRVGLEAEAERERRSLSNMIVVLLEEAIAARRAQKQAAA